jgi:hypothetical protein
VIASELAEIGSAVAIPPQSPVFGGREVGMMVMSRVGVIVALGALSMLGRQARSNLAEHPRRRA